MQVPYGSELRKPIKDMQILVPPFFNCEKDKEPLSSSKQDEKFIMPRFHHNSNDTGEISFYFV